MSEIPLPENGAELPHGKHRKGALARLADPMLASVPTLVGVLVGALTSHFAEIQRVDFERSDRFRREQIERVAAIAHGYDSLAEPLNRMISTVETRKPGICKYLPLAQTTEQRLQKNGQLHERMFGSDQTYSTNAAKYGHELDAIAAQSPAGKSAADFLNTIIGFYSGMLAGVLSAQMQYAQNREAFQATLIFETKVYFPDRIRKDVNASVSGFDAVEREITSTRSPDLLCKLDIAQIRNQLSALSLRSSKQMIAFAQTLEPELKDDSIQR